MKTMTKTSLIGLAVAAAVAVAPQAAFAHKSKKAHSHRAAKSSVLVAPTTRAVAAPIAAGSSATDARLRQLEQEVQALRGELNRTRTETKTAVASISEKADASQKAVEARLVENTTDRHDGKSTLSFRGGFAQNEHARGTAAAGVDALAGGAPNSVPGLTGADATRSNDGGEGWYVGAAIDHRLSNNLWGMSDIMAVDGELMFEYKNFGRGFNAVTGTYNYVTQFTLSAAPKIRFDTGTAFTPWIIPAGLAIHVVSPPSNGVTVLNPGLMIGAGGEIALSEALVAGVDFRYHFTGDDLKGSNTQKGLLNTGNGQTLPPGTNLSSGGVQLNNGINTNGFTTGAYLGFKF